MGVFYDSGSAGQVVLGKQHVSPDMSRLRDWRDTELCRRGGWRLARSPFGTYWYDQAPHGRWPIAAASDAGAIVEFNRVMDGWGVVG